jgi:hypothetical protein
MSAQPAAALMRSKIFAAPDAGSLRVGHLPETDYDIARSTALPLLFSKSKENSMLLPLGF